MARGPIPAVLGAVLLWTAPSFAQNQAPPNTPVAKYWLRMYPLEPFESYWHVTLTVDSVQKATAAALEIMKKNGGEPTIPLALEVSSRKDPYQQLSYKVSAAKTGKIVKALQKLGAAESSSRVPVTAPSVFVEAKDKLLKLEAETGSNIEALSKMPAVSALANELVEHLVNVVRVHDASKDRALLNIELKQAAPK
ncbi:MAG: hypothetical protein HY059_22305 [Proteobacteria bacterium]|nr:hypothetical protein [Pseudomonadota bacterium]